LAMTASWQYSCISKMTYKPIKKGETDVVFVYVQSLSVGLCMRNYKSLRVAVIICAIMVNTDRHTDKQILSGCITSSAR